MLLRNIIRYSARSWIYHGKVTANRQNHIRQFSKSCYVIIEEKLLSTRTTSIKTNHDIKRFYTDEVNQNSSPYPVLPPLTDDEKRAFPNAFVGLRSIYNVYAVIKARLDSDFSLPDFYKGSQQAVRMVSDALACEDYDSLDGLVDSNVIDKLRSKISSLSLKQKDLIRVFDREIIVKFPYEIKIVYENNGDEVRTFAEIEMVYQYLRGGMGLEGENSLSTIEIVSKPEFECRLVLSNYTFRKDYTNGNNEPWLISKCNHFSFITR